MPAPVPRPETFISTLTNSYQTLVPVLSSSTSEYAQGYRMRRFVGGFIMNADTVSATVIMSMWTGAADTEYFRVVLDATYFRYVFNQDDFRDLGTAYGIRIKTSAAVTTNQLVVIGRYQDQ
jgi:hypothetical protein